MRIYFYMFLVLSKPKCLNECKRPERCTVKHLWRLTLSAQILLHRLLYFPLLCPRVRGTYSQNLREGNVRPRLLRHARITIHTPQHTHHTLVCRVWADLDVWPLQLTWTFFLG